MDKIWNTADTKSKISMVFHGITTLLKTSNAGQSLDVVSRSNDAMYLETRSLMEAKIRKTAIER
jgi:hypothetical protein